MKYPFQWIDHTLIGGGMDHVTPSHSTGASCLQFRKGTEKDDKLHKCKKTTQQVDGSQP